MGVNIDTIRNVTLVGHGNVGKTTLAEAMLHQAGIVPRMGSIDQGNTVCDFDEIEKERKHSVDSAVVHFDYNNSFINLIDTPGYPDFVGQALCGLAPAETAIIVVPLQQALKLIRAE